MLQSLLYHSTIYLQYELVSDMVSVLCCSAVVCYGDMVFR